MNMRTVVLVVVMGMAATQSQAELLAGTPADATITAPVAVGDYGLGGNYPVLQARPFSTGSACSLTALVFGSNLYHESGLGGISFSIYHDSTSRPGGAVLGGQDLFSATESTIGQTLLPSSVLLLNANSSYWLVASVDQSLGDTKYWWNQTSTSTFETDFGGAGMPLAYANSTDGASWTDYSG